MTDGEKKGLGGEVVTFSPSNTSVNTAKSGFYEKLLLPGEHTVSASANGVKGASKDIVINKGESLVLGFVFFGL